MKQNGIERPVRVGLISLGCAKNLADAEIMLGTLLKDGVEITNDASEAERIIAAGHWIGFTGVVTFKNGTELREIARSIPRDRILIETDAPYLSPEPMRKGD